MDKIAALTALKKSPHVMVMHHDIEVDLSTITVRGVREPVLFIGQSELIGWIRMEGTNAVWRYGSLLTGGSSQPHSLGDPSQDGGLEAARAVDAAWSEIKPEWPPVGCADGEPERFAACIEAGELPAQWSKAIMPQEPTTASQQPPAQGAGTGSDSPFATDFNPYRHDQTRHPAASGLTEQQLDGRILESVYPAAAPAAIGAIALFLAILEMPYEFYVLLRVAVPAMAIWICTIASGQKKTGWIGVFAMAAVLWNPLIPIEMPRSAWVLPDLVGAALFAAAGYTMPASKPATRQESPAQL